MKIISLGGVGGCILATALREINQLAHPYDWLITAQSFIITSFNNFDLFFKFNTKEVHDNTKLITENKNGIMLHDFKIFELERENVIQKYKRRFERLNDNLNSNEDILFVRIYDNLKDETAGPPPELFCRENEDLKKWETFILFLQQKYSNKKIRLLIITNCKDIYNDELKNISICMIKDRSDMNEIKSIIDNNIKKGNG